MPKTLELPLEHSLLIKNQIGNLVNQVELEAFMTHYGKGGTNKTFIGVDRESNGDEYLIVGYFKGMFEQRRIDFRKINADDFIQHFNSSIENVVKQLVNVVLIGIGGTLFSEKVTDEHIKYESINKRDDALVAIKKLATQAYIKLALFIPYVENGILLKQRLKDIFNVSDLLDFLHHIYQISQSSMKVRNQVQPIRK